MQVVELRQVDIDAAEALRRTPPPPTELNPSAKAFIRALSDDSFGHRHFASR